eukprot:7224681-Lingulodinium_polyedra.AAC.1
MRAGQAGSGPGARVRNKGASILARPSFAMPISQQPLPGIPCTGRRATSLRTRGPSPTWTDSLQVPQ